MPSFSIVIPAKGRPAYTHDAVFSALRQDFDEFDVTLSNSGADPAVRDAIKKFKNEPRFNYIEQPNALNMSSHWEAATKTVTGGSRISKPPSYHLS